MKEITSKDMVAGRIYGTLTSNFTPRKGWVQKVQWAVEKYGVFCADNQGIGLGDYWTNNQNFSSLKAIIHDSGFRVFQFDNAEELFGWLGGYIATPAVPVVKKPAKKKSNKKVYKFEYPIHGQTYNGYETRIVVVDEETDTHILGQDYHTGNGQVRSFLKLKIRGEIEKVN